MTTPEREALYNFYASNMDDIEESWAQHVSESEWGSGEDEISITEDMFWEYVEKYRDEHFINSEYSA